jgi:hypothetical protein
LKILCSGYLLRYPLGGFSWHHLQYLVGLMQLGHEVTYCEDYGWEGSCYDPASDEMTDDPSYGIQYLTQLLKPFALEERWCFLAADGAAHGLTRAELAQICRETDLYITLSNMNTIPETGVCRRRILIDTDPVFTQIRGHGMEESFDNYHVLYTYAENIHQEGCSVPAAGTRWLPTRQPVVLNLWKTSHGNDNGPLTTIMNWSAYGDREHHGITYGQKDRQFRPFFSLPKKVNHTMELAVNAPDQVVQQLQEGGWVIVDPKARTTTPASFQDYIVRSKGEFSVAKHAYVVTCSGWFSDRSTGYLASGRPVILQNTGFSRILPCGEGLLTFDDELSAEKAILGLADNYEDHCLAARKIAEEYFDSRKVLNELLERSI